MLGNTKKEFQAQVSHFLLSRTLHNFSWLSLSLQAKSCWHLAPVSQAWCGWGCRSNSTHRVTFPRNYGGWDMSQLKSFTGVFISIWCSPMSSTVPGLSKTSTGWCRTLDANHLQIHGPGSSHKSHWGCWYLPQHPWLIPTLRDKSKTQAPELELFLPWYTLWTQKAAVTLMDDGVPLLTSGSG